MATVSAEYLGMLGLHQHHVQSSHLPQQSFGGLIVRSTTPSTSESSETSSSDSVDGASSSDRQSLVQSPHQVAAQSMLGDPVHDPSPLKLSNSIKAENDVTNNDQNENCDSSDSDDGSNSSMDDSECGDLDIENPHEENGEQSNEAQQKLTVIKPEPTYDSSYGTPVNSRISAYSPYDSASKAITPTYQNGNFESPALRKNPTESTPTGQRSQPIKRNFSEASIHGSFMAHPAQQAMFNPAAMMMLAAQMAGPEAMANMSAGGMIPHPWMLANMAMANGNHGNSHNRDNSNPEGAPLDLSSFETPSKKLKRTPSPDRSGRDEPINLSVATSRGQEQQKRSSSLTTGGATHQQQRLMEDLVKRQLNQKEALKLQEVLYYEHMLLLTQLTSRSEVEGHQGGFQRLHHIYMMEVDRIEKERYKDIMGNLSDQQRQATLTSYDQERLTLVLRIKQELAMLLAGSVQKTDIKPLAHVPVKTAKTQQHQQPKLPSFNASMQMHQPQPIMYPMGPSMGAAMSATMSATMSPTMGATMGAGMGAGMGMMYPFKQQHSSPPDDDNKERMKKFLSPGAVKVLMEWYAQNEEHPYPEEDTVQLLAMKAQVSPAQVKKWMANKRVRSSNTLAHNGSIHPKKLQKVLQIQEMTRWMTSPEHQQQQQQTPQQPMEHARQVVTSSGAKKSKRALNPVAVESMNRWYFSHLHYPYPTDEEKIQLAKEGNITVAQVTCWFANKRNRSNNAKKFSPVMMTPEDKSSMYGGFKKQQQKDTTSPNGYPEGYLQAIQQNFQQNLQNAVSHEAHQAYDHIRRQNDRMTSPNAYNNVPARCYNNASPDVSTDDSHSQRRENSTAHSSTHSTASSVTSSTDYSPEGSGDEGRLLIDEARPQMQSLDASPPSPVSH